MPADGIGHDTERIRRMWNGQETHASGQGILLYVTRPLAISGKM